MSPRPAHVRLVTASQRGSEPIRDQSRDQSAAEAAEVSGADGSGVDVRDFDALYRRYASYVAAIAVRILGRDHELDDLVQDAFLNALKGLAGLREPAAIKGWLAKITVRLATRRLRARRLRRVLFLDRDVRDWDAADSKPICAPSASDEQRALVAKVYRVLDRLPAAERVAWILRYVQGEPLHRIPELCDCSLSTAQRRLARAQAALETELAHD